VQFGDPSPRQNSDMATTIRESHRDLLDAQFGTLATVASDGSPQLTEVLFLRDGDGVRISLNTSRAKTRNLRARPQCSLLILDVANPYRYLELRGRARIELTTTTPSPTASAPSTAPTCTRTTHPATAASS
jgi:PPOX class probable F420-dependent enzyme